MRTLPSLVEILINQCQTLFGPQVTSLLGEIANDSGAEESDSLHCKYKLEIHHPSQRIHQNMRNITTKTIIIFSTGSIFGQYRTQQRSKILKQRFRTDAVRR